MNSHFPSSFTFKETSTSSQERGGSTKHEQVGIYQHTSSPESYMFIIRCVKKHFHSASFFPANLAFGLYMARHEGVECLELLTAS